MKSEEISKLLDSIKLQISEILDPSQRISFSTLFNLVEFMFTENEKQRKEIQLLKDEINRLKGEQGKPDIKGKNNPKGNDLSSEQERKKQNREHDARRSERQPEQRTCDQGVTTQPPKYERVSRRREQDCKDISGSSARAPGNFA